LQPRPEKLKNGGIDKDDFLQYTKKEIFINRRGDAMLIRVIYKDNAHDYVKDFQLGRFLDAGKVVKFQRRTGWVTVGVDPVRNNNHTSYIGTERRAGSNKA
jgi:hypothetical protein